MSTLSATNIKNASSGSNNIVLGTDGGVTVTTIQGIIKQGTAVASTSGTAIDFTSIPSWVKRVTVMFNGVSTNATTNIVVQIGPSGGVETTGYIGCCQVNGAGINDNATNLGFDVFEFGVATFAASGNCILTLLDSSTNTWAASSILAHSSRIVTMGGAKPITGGVLSRIRITSTAGTAVFDAGTINIVYEG